jgi:hypothetical protein
MFDTDTKTEADMRELLADLLLDDEDLAAGRRDVRSFEDSGLLTRNEGLVVRMEDGSEFQVTIVKSR